MEGERARMMGAEEASKDGMPHDDAGNERRKRFRDGLTHREKQGPREGLRERALSPHQVQSAQGPRWTLGAKLRSESQTPAFLAGLWAQAREGLFTDVIFSFSDGPRILAHRNVLCAKSAIFQRMFSSNMIEAKTGVINISDFSRRSFFCFLELLYLDAPGSGWDSNVDGRELWSLADKYDVQSVKDCLLRALDESNVPAAASYALSHWDPSDNPLAEACAAVGSKRIRCITALEGVSSEVIGLLLCGDVTGKRAQLDRFQLIQRWCVATNATASSAEVQGLLSRIRFGAIAREDFEAFVRTSCLVSDEQILSLRPGRVTPVRGWRVTGAIGSRGSAPGQLLEPRGIAVTMDGHIVVCDSGNKRVQVLSAIGGRELRTLGRGGGGGVDVDMEHPCRVTVCRESGHILVTDSSRNMVHRFSRDGSELLHSFGSTGVGQGQFRGAWGIAVSGGGREVYVTDINNHRVQVFDEHGAFLRSFGGQGSNAGELLMPCGVTVNHQGTEVIVVDGGNNRLAVFTPEGEFVRLVRGLGLLSALERPDDVAVGPSGEVVVSCWKQNKVEVFDAQGAYLRTHTGAEDTKEGRGRLCIPSGVALGAAGELYVVEFGGSRVRVFCDGVAAA
uniref:BTB domain-containing protein n=1 Tax=Hemiselmis andersenii TaxID=464988 RepID=A0A6U2A1H3_HEMAN|mmetsp:Transcript_10051/g.23509  ORF Transcript_10051/g.23509 Transcript_10051/m.23509 type:complete len:619 (+) Transcript_10051:56-1912(+)